MAWCEVTSCRLRAGQIVVWLPGTVPLDYRTDLILHIWKGKGDWLEFLVIRNVCTLGKTTTDSITELSVLVYCNRTPP